MVFFQLLQATGDKLQIDPVGLEFFSFNTQQLSKNMATGFWLSAHLV